MENLDDLLHKACKGSKEAFGTIYKLYYTKIYRYCRINLSNTSEAEDLAQETFLKAWRALPTFSTYNGSSIQAFLFKIARNAMIDLSRKKKELPLDTALEVESKEDIEEGLDKKNNIETVQKALLKLEGDERQLVVLRFFEEMHSKDIAQILNLNEGAVRVRIHRILKKLREILSD